MERKNSTNLNIGEDRKGDKLSRDASRSASPIWSSSHHKTSRVKDAGFNKHCDDSLV